MTQRFYNTLLFLLFTVFLPITAAGQNYNVLFIRDTRWVELTRKGGKGLLIRADSTIGFNALRNSVAVSYTHLLPIDSCNTQQHIHL